MSRYFWRGSCVGTSSKYARKESEITTKQNNNKKTKQHKQHTVRSSCWGLWKLRIEATGCCCCGGSWHISKKTRISWIGIGSVRATYRLPSSTNVPVLIDVILLSPRCLDRKCTGKIEYRCSKHLFLQSGDVGETGEVRAFVYREIVCVKSSTFCRKTKRVDTVRGLNV